jgi:1-acyl-sn-glycerol-3-phosphate acyltransferase
MSNHRSHYDITLTILSLPASIRMLTKKELFKIPLWGRGMAAGEFISIDRNNIEQAKQDLKKAREKMEDGIVLWIAPEGTRSRTGRMGPFKKGGFILAIEAGAQIIPVGIRGSEKVLQPKTWEFFLDQKVDVHIGKPIDASVYTMENKDELIEAVRREISVLCGEA